MPLDGIKHKAEYQLESHNNVLEKEMKTFVLERLKF